MRLALILTTAASPLAAEPFLHWPVDCDLGKTCFIEDYVDRNADDGAARDFTCGLNTRDGHKGTDISLFDMDLYQKGVAVTAAADGIVVGARDSMVDDPTMPGVTDNNACGNGVVLRHSDGYTTQYCHLKLGSIAVAPNDRVNAGDLLGLIGLSGKTVHPHVHMTVRQKGAVVDPFDAAPDLDCDAPKDSLWLETPDYHRTLLRFAGFSDHVPGYPELREGTARLRQSGSNDPLVVYAELGYAQHGDVVTIRAEGPDGEIFEHDRVMKSPKVSQLPAFGKKAPPGGWAEGHYTGQVIVTRRGTVIANRWAHIKVTAAD